ncbi:MAG: TetR/AcrR family transcriptional regulator [Pseudomonadota bacterium]
MARLSRDESRSITIEKLKAAALTEFARLGFGGASVDRICEAAGYSRGAFYANYKTKQDLLLDLLNEYNAGEIAEWRNVISSAHDMEAIYADMGARFERYVGKAEWGMFAVEVLLQAKRNPEFADKYRVYQEALMDSVAQALGMMFDKAGRVAPAPMIDLATALRSYTTGLSLDYGVSASRNNAHTASTLLTLFLRGLIAQGEPLR